MHQQDKKINKAFYAVKDSSMLIQSLNLSSNVEMKSSTYRERLLKCSDTYSNAISSIEKYAKQKDFMEKNLNVARLHFLMAENQARLGSFVKVM